MRKFYLMVLAIIFATASTISAMGAPPKEVEEKPKDPGVYNFYVGPFDKRNILGGKVSFLPRFYYMLDGKRKSKRQKLKSIEYKVGDKIIYKSEKKPFWLSANFINWENGNYPVEVNAITTNGTKYTFKTNMIISNVNVIVRVKIKTPPPKGYNVYLAGSASVLLKKDSLDEWNPRALKMKKKDDIYEASFKIGLYERLQMEFTLGSWALKARKPDGVVDRITVKKITKPNQVIDIVLDSFGKPRGKIKSTGYVTSFTGNGKNITIAYTQRKDQVATLNYSYDGKNYKTMQSTATQFCHFNIPAQWGNELKFFFTPAKKIKTNTLALPKRNVYPFDFLVVGDIRGDYKTKIPKLMAKDAGNFVVDSGDLVMEGLKASDWTAFFGVHKPILQKFLWQPSPGNHEEESPFYPAISGLPFYYSYSWNNCYFISVDNNAPYEPGTKQYKWMIKELKKAQKYKFKFVYFHISPWTTRKHACNIEIQNALGPAFEKYGVDVVFSGDDHGYEASYPLKNGKVVDKGGVIYIVSAGGGAYLYDSTYRPKWSRFEKKAFHYLKVTVDKNKVVIKAIDDKGKVFDTIEVK